MLHTNKGANSLEFATKPHQAPEDLYLHSWVCVSSWSKEHGKPVYRCASVCQEQSGFAIPSYLDVLAMGHCKERAGNWG